MSFDLQKHPHRRYNALSGEWVLVSPGRMERPWLGEVEALRQEVRPAYDPECHLCPGNPRAGGILNPSYEGPFVFDNDFPALRPEQVDGNSGGLLVAQPEPGVCRVLCFSQRHDLSLSSLSAFGVRQIVDAWAEQYRELGAIPFINWVQIFENRGAMMGTSNPHPHCQIWANFAAPNELARESVSQFAYRSDRGGCLLCDYLAVELKCGERVVCENRAYAAVVPFWAVWPFETMLIGKSHAAALDELGESDRSDLAEILKMVTTGYDQLFAVPFPYSMGFHQRPSDGLQHPEWHLHAHFYPPLLRSSTIRKYMVGYEMLGTPQRDVTAETAAESLRRVFRSAV